MEKTFAICTLGCKVNAYESEAVAEQFAAAGYRQVPFHQIADVYIVNTCTVTHLSDRKSRQMIRRSKQKNPNSVLVVMGCYAQVAAEDVGKIPEVDIILGNEVKAKVLERTQTFLREREPMCCVTDIGKAKTFEQLFVCGSDRTRAVLKVQDGCNNFCAYCIIPYARGRIRSNPLENCLRDAEKLAKAGFTELVLTGIHLASYGKDFGGPYLIDLLEALEQIPGIRRIRLGSLEPTLFEEAFVMRMKKLTKLCPHFHLSLQSGCDATLMRMNRKYTTEEYLDAVKRIRAVFPDAAITTDIMTGFPGETEEEFSETLQFAETVAFADAHIFCYSVRKGTKAAAMPQQVSPEQKEERSKRLHALTSKSQESFLNAFIGKELLVLFEQKHKAQKEYFEGKSDNYITVLAKAEYDVCGTYHTVRIETVKNGLAYGEIIR